MFAGGAVEHPAVEHGPQGDGDAQKLLLPAQVRQGRDDLQSRVVGLGQLLVGGVLAKTVQIGQLVHGHRREGLADQRDLPAQARVHHAADQSGGGAPIDAAVGGEGAGGVISGEDAGPVQAVHRLVTGIFRGHVGDRPFLDAADLRQGLVGQSGADDHGKVRPGDGLAQLTVAVVPGDEPGIQGVVQVGLIPGLPAAEVRRLALVGTVDAAGHDHCLGQGQRAVRGEAPAAHAVHQAVLNGGADTFSAPALSGHVGELPLCVGVDLLEVGKALLRCQGRRTQAGGDCQS